MAHLSEIFSDNKNKIVKTAVAGGFAAAALAGCASPEAPEATATSTSKPSASEENTPTASETSRPSPTDIPELPVDETEITESPEAPSQSPEAGFIVNYESFVNWETMDKFQQKAACNELFIENGATDGVALSELSSGEAIINWHSQRSEIALNLNLDMSDERNGEIALKLADCLTIQRQPGSNDAAMLYENRFKLLRGYEKVPNKITHVTRYGDGQLFLAGEVGYTRQDGVFDNGFYTARVVEYEKETELGDEIVQAVFEWDHETEDWNIVAEYDENEVLDYGPSVVVLDESRANAPRQF